MHIHKADLITYTRNMCKKSPQFKKKNNLEFINVIQHQEMHCLHGL